jgi:hypothetical protein
MLPPMSLKSGPIIATLLVFVWLAGISAQQAVLVHVSLAHSEEREHASTADHPGHSHDATDQYEQDHSHGLVPTIPAIPTARIPILQSLIATAAVPSSMALPAELVGQFVHAPNPRAYTEIYIAHSVLLL